MFERNQRIAVRDYLKQKIHNLNEYSIKYQHRMIMEMLSANKQVKRQRSIYRSQKLLQAADKTTDLTVSRLKNNFNDELTAKRLALQMKAQLRKRNEVTTTNLDTQVEKAENLELRSYKLQDRKLELKQQLEINQDLDQEMKDYIKFEKDKNVRMMKELAQLKS